jgi:hypothetical protein
MFKNAHGEWWTVSGSHVKSFMQRVCICWHIDCLISHCCWVTVAATLFKAGDTEEVCLQWNADAI